MNCPYCGCMVAPGSSYCPACRKALYAGMSTGAYAPQPSYTMPMNYSQPYSAVATMGYSQPYPSVPMQTQSIAPTGYSQPYAPISPSTQPTKPQVTVSNQQSKYPSAYSHSQMPQKSDQMATSVKEIPYRFFQSFRASGTLLRELVQTNGFLVCIAFLVIAFVLVFLAGMLLTQGFVSLLFSLFSTASGVPIANDTASLQQGVSYVSSQISISVGGLTVLWQLSFMLAPLLTMSLYLRFACNITLSPMLLLGFASVTATPSIVSAILCIIVSFFAPWLSVLIIAVSLMMSYLQINDMLCAITMQNDFPLKQKMLWFSASITLTLVLVGLILALLFGQMMTQVLQLLFSSGLRF